MTGFVLVSSMFVANTSAVIVYAVDGEAGLAVLCLLGAVVTAYGVRKTLKD